MALVAGASRGLGLAVARELGRAGYPLVVCARTADELNRGADLLRDDGYEVEAMVCDVSDHEVVEAMVATVERQIGPIEVMVCVAGIIQVGPLAALRRSHFESAIGTMLWGPVNTSLAVSERMRRRGRGRIGVITSIGGQIAAPHLLPYSTAKFGAVGFSRGLRSELADSRVTVTTVIPGLMRTGSPGRASFVGDHGREYAWFATAASLPVLSIDADRAARRIVQGVLRGSSTVVLTPLAALAPVVAAVAPRTTAALLATVQRMLPSAPGSSRIGPADTIDGWQAVRRLTARTRALVDRLTVWNQRAAQRLNEPSGRGSAPDEA